MNIVTTEEALAEVASSYRGVDFAWDVETMGEDRLDHHTNQVVWLSLATHGRVDVIPMGHPNGDFVRWDKPLLATGVKRQSEGKELREKDYSQNEARWVPVFTDPPEQLLPSQVWTALAPIFRDPEVIKAAHNLRFDAKAVAKYLGFVPSPPYWDTMVTAWVLEPHLDKSLDQVLKRTLGYEMEKGVGKCVEMHSFTDVATYAALDARWTWLLAMRQGEIMEANESPIWDLEMDCLEVVISMEMHGVRIDEDHLVPLRDRLQEQLYERRLRVIEAAGQDFNVNSNADKQRILFGPKAEGGQGLKPVKMTPSGSPSVDAKSLERLRTNPVASALLEYQDTYKLLSTYVTPYMGGEVERTVGGKTVTKTVQRLVKDGRIHGSFNQTGAETGRFSSSNPNLQNVPNARTDNGRAIRNLFIADESHRLVVADFSQIEPRIIASLSGDQRMIDAYLKGEDIYLTVAEPLGIDRPAGKVLVLALAYGIGPDAVAEQLKITPQKAKAHMEAFVKAFPAIEAYRRRVIINARSKNPPAIKTHYGRVRVLPDLTSQNTYERSRAERQAFNAVIQGSAADVMKKALVNIYRSLPDGAKIVLTVHDEVVVSSPVEVIDESVEAVTRGMVGITDFKVPFEIDLKVVDRWGEAK